MNNRYFHNTTFSTFLFILIFTSFSYGQKDTQIPTFEGKIVTDVSKNQLKQNFKRQETFELPTRELSAWVQGKSTTQFELELGDKHQWKITLFDSNLHAENYVTRVRTENGIVAMPRATNAVFKGYLNDDYDNEVRLTIAEGFIFGFVNTGTEQYYIEPLKHHDKQAKSDHFVLYKNQDIVSDEDAFCGAKDIENERQEVEAHKQNTLACLEAELAQAADYSMYNKYGSVEALNLYMDGIMNVVATYYDDEFAEQIVILVSERYMVACEGCDPWLPTSDYNIIFPSFQAWANSAEGFVAPHDMICLWTDRDIGFGGPSGAVGVVDNIGQVCNPRGSSTIFEDFSNVLSEMEIMITHEIGHLFGAFHNYSFGCNQSRGPFIMDPFVSPAIGWSTGTEPCTLPGGSVGAINAYVATITCLGNCVGLACENAEIGSLGITNISSNSISFAWDSVAVNYQVRSRPYGTSVWTYTNTTSVNNETISGLSCSTAYEVQVRTDCGNGVFGPPRTTSTSTTGLNINALNTTNCGGGLYDLDLVIDTENAAQGGSFDVIVDGNTTTQTYNGTNPQTVIISGLSADGRIGIVASIGDATCQQSTTYNAPPPTCICTPVLVENFDDCRLPKDWTNVSAGDTTAFWNFGLSTSGEGTPAGSLDGTCMVFFDDYIYDDNGGERVVLTSPIIDMTDYLYANLEFDYNFFTYYPGTFNVEVFDGTNWVNVLNETTSACGPWNDCTPPHADISIQQFANPDFQVAFTFDDGGDRQWFAAIDNFSICGTVDSCAAINPDFVICHGDEFSYDLTQQASAVNPLGATVTWYDGQPSSGTATIIDPATSVDLTSVDLWASVLTANACTKETPITYQLSPDLSITNSIDTICAGATVQLCATAFIPATDIEWTDESGTSIGMAYCVSVMPSSTTTYNATYTDTLGCVHTLPTTVHILTELPAPTVFDTNICESDDFINYDLTQWDTYLGGNMGTSTINWYDGQPSGNGTDITSTADATDVTGMPDLWALVTDGATNCPQEIDFNYQMDYNPTITCPADITVNNDPDTCGAFVNIPLVTAADDSVSLFLFNQNIQLDYLAEGTPLQFDFAVTDIDPTQAVSLSITAVGDLDDPTYEYYSIIDENEVTLTRLQGLLCEENIFTYTIPASDINTFAANDTITFIAMPTFAVSGTCGTDYVEMELSYTSLTELYMTIANDYNTGGADASGYYLPGTTTVTYTVTDGCGNTDTCSIDITVNQELLSGEDFNFSACGDLMNYDLTQWDTYLGGSMGTSTVRWYDGQPTADGTDISPTADATDITSSPDLWVLAMDSVGCTQEIDVIYQIDLPPTITCPADITVNNDPDSCGAFVNIPLATVADDSITILPNMQNIQLDYLGGGLALQFDFTTAGIDLTQPVNLSVTVVGDLDSSIEYYDIFDENGVAIKRINGFTACQENVFTYTIPASDINTFAVDGIITFTATPSFGVDFGVCDLNLNYAEMQLSYTSFTESYISVINDYNGGGADASGYYLPGTTTVTYAVLDGCGNTDTCSIDITVNQELLSGADFNFSACGDLMNYDLTQWDTYFGGSMGTSTVSWYDGQPTANGTDISPTADATDITGLPDLWVLTMNNVGCTQEIDINYQLDFPPVITCPADITVNNDPDTCGAFINIPIATATDDSITILPDIQNIQLDYLGGELSLQFDFPTANIDLTQPVSLNVAAAGDLDNFGEYYDITDENGVSLVELNGLLCQENIFTYNIPVSDINTFAADGTITFIATPTSGVGASLCIENYVIMELSYTSFTESYISITNDYNTGGADASGFYLPGTTMVTYTVTDGCGNVETCSVDVTVNQEILSGEDFNFSACGDLMNYDLTQWDTYFGGSMGTSTSSPMISWYNGQPTANGTDISPTADDIDITGLPDLWVLTSDSIGCTQEIDINYQLDFPPVITCPADMTVNNDPDTCGAFINIPIATVTDDSITTLPDMQNIQLDYLGGGIALQFDFPTANIDLTQPVRLSVTAVGDLDSFSEYYDIVDENGVLQAQLRGILCQENVFTYNIPVGDINTFAADGTITFIATPTTGVDAGVCDLNLNYVAMELSYTSFTESYIEITNDYNTGGADASGFYLPGTTVVTYTVTDGCGNVETCSVDVTVNQETTQGEDFELIVCGDLMNYDLTQWNTAFGGSMGSPTVTWYDQQPSSNGIDITSTADSIDLTAMPDLWVLLSDFTTFCLQEINVNYTFDNAPQLTCPPDITVDADLGTCAANVTLPPIIVMDDDLISLPDTQTVVNTHTLIEQNLLFDFEGANIDASQDATLNIAAIGDLGLSHEYYNLYDENGNSIGIFGDNSSVDCDLETATFTITANDLATFLADNVITFTAIPTSTVSPTVCDDNDVEMTLSYTPLMTRYFAVTNDFNNGGADASGNYPSGTTTVTYTVTDGCGNVSTCSTDITVNQGTSEGIFDIVTDAEVVCTGGATELCLDLSGENHNGTVEWTDDMGNVIDTTLCIIVAPSADTTTYTAIYTFQSACIDVSQITIASATTSPLTSTVLDLNICIPENVTSFDLTTYNDTIIGSNNESINWYIGQPSAGGVDITPLAANVNLNVISDLWVLVTNTLTNCTREVNFMFEIDRAPILTCPAAITVNNDPDTCGAFINIPLATVMDDSLTLLPGMQNIQLGYIEGGVPLQFDFPTTNIDLTQPVSLNVTAVGDLDSFSEYYDIVDENGVLQAQLRGVLCQENVFTYTIPVSNINTFAADNIITFTAIPSSGVDLGVCTFNYVEMQLSYTSFAELYIAINNDYNNNGADASGFYPPGTTTVTYAAIDGCGNVDTCSVDITVNQEIVQSDDFDFIACGDLINYDLTQWNTYFGGSMGSPTITWYDGQPSVNGDDIAPTSDSIDLTAIPDVWVLLTDTIGCTEEINLNYQLDYPPVITCPMAITVDAAPGECGAEVTIPPVVVMDDSISILPGEQSVFVNYISSFQNLQFDFEGSNIDPSQAATLTITAYGDLNLSSEYYDIFDENGNFFARLGENVTVDCESETATFTIPPGDLLAFLTDNVITFTAAPTSNISDFCTINGLSMTLSYERLSIEYFTLTNDYNGSSDASGYYPSGTTPVTYVVTDGCGNTDTCIVEVTVNQTPFTDSTFTADYCGDITAIDLTIYDEVLQTNTTDMVRWFIGQPSANGTDITATANSTDLSAMPDIWAQILQDSLGCITERDIVYQLDTSPVFTSCPSDIMIDAIPGICGAFVTVPLPIVEDDSITTLIPSSSIVMDYTVTGESLQFDFDGTLIDVSQPATLTVNAIGDLSSSFEYFDILDENANPIGRVGDTFSVDCMLETTTITIAPADLATFLTDNVLTFITGSNNNVSAFICINRQVEMILSYTSLGGTQYFNITNDYNNGGADASGLYPSGTTLVTYVATDGCGNTDTCQVNVTVNQAPLMGELIAVSDSICRNDSTTICIVEPLAGQIIWTNDTGNTLPQTEICISIAPDTTTTYTANYLAINGCSYIAETTINVYELIVNDPMLSFCQGEDVSNVDLTLYNADVSPADTVDWYDGNPTDDGTFIYPPTAVDLSMINDLWALATDANGCTDAVDVSVSYDQGLAPVGTAICFSSDTLELAEILVIIPEDYPTPENLMYRLDNGAFQTANRFTVSDFSVHNVTIMDITTACEYDVEVFCFLLPVELTFFSVHCIDNQYVLDWETATESEVSEFVVERSIDGVNFSDLGQVAAAGNSDVPQSYQFIDETIQTGHYYYRLRIVEADGTSSYSPVEVAECLGAKYAAFDIFPNPTDAQLNVVFESTDNKVLNFKLRDILGRTIMDEDITPQIGLNVKTIDMSDLSSAVYFVIVNDGMVVRKVVKK